MFDIKNLFRADNRSAKAKKNIVAAAFIKGADTLIYLLLVPLTLGYLNAYEYGIWLTLNSILNWIDSFDIGLGSGLRNKLAIAEAENDKVKARCYVSTTFIMLILIAGVLIGIFTIALKYINWYSVLNVDIGTVPRIREIIGISFMFFCLNFIFKIIGNVYQAKQQPAVNYLIAFSGHFLSLLLIYILTKVTIGSLYWVGIVYSASPTIVYFFCYPITFRLLFPYLSPSIRYFKINLLKELMSLSVLFFVLQIMGIVLFSLSNIIISNMFGPDQVTPYNIAYRYFSIISMLFSLFLAPIWSASTDAYARGELEWIRKCMLKLTKVMFVVLMIIFIMILISPIVYRLWIGSDVEIPFMLSILMGGYMFIMLWSLCFSSILNGIGALFLQILNIIGMALLFYPACWFFGGRYGVSGIVIAMCVLNIPGAFLNTLQLNKIIHGKAVGYWIK